MATQIGSGTGVLATYLANLADTSNIETALKQLYYGTTNGTLSQTTGIYGALYTLYSGSPTIGGVGGTVTIAGNLTVSGTTTTINSTTLNVDDIMIELGAVTTPSNTTANGGGITLLAGAGGNKTITWDSTNANWTTSENWNLAAGKALRIGAGGSTTNVISGTAATLLVGENATGLTLGASTTGTSTVDIAVGATNLATKTVNIGTGSSSGTHSTVVNIGTSAGSGGIFNHGLVYTIQPSPTTGLTTSQTLTIAQLETLIITTAQSAPITLSLPTGTSIEGGLPTSSPNGTSFDFSIINAGSSGTVTIGAGGNTFVGSTSVAFGTSARLRVLKNATNAYTIYRIS